MVGTNLGKCEQVWEEKLIWLNPRWWNSSWQNSRWLLSSNWVRKNEWIIFVQIAESKMAAFRYAIIRVRWEWMSLSQIESLCQSFVQNGWIQEGRIQDGCHHLVNQIALVWVRISVERECFWVNLRENKKVMNLNGSVWIQNGSIQDGCHHQV